MKNKILFLLLFISSIAIAQTTTTPVGSIRHNNELVTDTISEAIVVRNATTKMLQSISKTKLASQIIASVPNATTTVKGKVKLAGDLGGTADLPTVPSLINKVDKVAGKQLSTKDYTTIEQNKLSGIATGAEVNVNADWNAVSGDALILNKPTIPSGVTNISVGNKTATTFDINSSTGTGATIPQATITEAGLLNASDKVLVNTIAGKINTIEKAAANGVATLDAAGKVPLTQINDVLLGAVNYKGVYNASNNTPDLPVATSNKGYYYIVSTAGTQFGLVLAIGDWIISNGVAYGKVDNNNAVTSVAGRVGAVVLTKTDVGLPLADNTSDLNKVVSNPTLTALNLKANLAGGNSFTGNQTVNGNVFGDRILLNNGSSSLPSFSFVNGNSTGFYFDSSISQIVFTQGGSFALRFSSGGTVAPSYRVGNVAGSDEAISSNRIFYLGAFTTASEPVYTRGAQFFNTTLNRLRVGGATQYETIPNFADLNGKENTITSGTTAQYFRGDKTFQTLNSTAVGLGNVDNTTDLNKPISTATQTALNARITGTGTTNQLTKFTASGAIGNSGVTELANGNVGINTTNPTERLDVVGNGKFSGSVSFGGQLTNSRAAGLNTGIVHQTTGINAMIMGFNNSGVANNEGVPHNTGFMGSLNSYSTAVVGNGAVIATFVSTLQGAQGINVNGVVTATSFFQSSDIRKKNIIKRDGDVIYYTWKDKRDTNTHIGYIAQKVRVTNPDQVNKDDKGMLSVNYIEILVEKIRNLEKEIELLKAK